jgi:transketolase C-terminal domain/subunit
VNSPSAARAKSGSLQRTIGYVTTGVGLLGMATGGFLSYRAYDLNRQSMDECRSDAPNSCTKSGVEMRDNAQSHATGATVAFAVGTGLLATGIVLIATAPKAERKAALKLWTQASYDGGRVSLEGAW